MRRVSEQLLDWLRAERLRLLIGQTCALSEAAQAHRDLADRRTQGKLVLLPGR